MTKIEFLSDLKIALLEELNVSETNDNIRYYERYFEEKQSAGYSEAEIISELGNPRLLAKTIIEASKMARGVDDVVYFNDDNSDRHEEKKDYGFKSSQMKSIWAKILSVVVLILCAVLVISIIGGILTIAFTFILPVILVLVVIGAIKYWFESRH